MLKFTVEYNDETRIFEVVEWMELVDGIRTGSTVSRHVIRYGAETDCSLLNEGYEYAISAMCESEFDEVTV